MTLLQSQKPLPVDGSSRFQLAIKVLSCSLRSNVFFLPDFRNSLHSRSPDCRSGRTGDRTRKQARILYRLALRRGTETRRDSALTPNRNSDRKISHPDRSDRSENSANSRNNRFRSGRTASRTEQSRSPDSFRRKNQRSQRPYRRLSPAKTRCSRRLQLRFPENCRRANPAFRISRSPTGRKLNRTCLLHRSKTLRNRQRAEQFSILLFRTKTRNQQNPR